MVAMGVILRSGALHNAPPLSVGCSLEFPAAFTSLPPTGPPSGKRLYLWPGLDVSLTTWDLGAPAQFVSDMRANGHHVVLANLPKPQPCFFTNGGWQYRDAFIAALNRLMNSVEAASGPAFSIAGGLSYGGLHAMIAAAQNGRINAWFAHVPVVRIDALAEFPSVGEVRRFNPQFDVSALATSRGLLTWATADERVNWRLTRDLSLKLMATVSRIEYPGQVHETNAANAIDLSAWVNSQ